MYYFEQAAPCFTGTTAMIESIHLADAATFRGTYDVPNLKLMNYFYGSNGVGKSTIANLIENEECHANCKVTWKNNFKLKAMVYNRQFVDANSSKVAELHGVFTLGQQEIELDIKIRDAQEACRKTQEDITNYIITLNGDETRGGKRAELQTKEDDFRDRCWQVKKKFDAEFREAFEGVHSAKEKFKERVSNEKKRNNSSVEKLADLQKRALTIFGPTQSLVDHISEVNFMRLVELESAVILKKKVVGKEDVDIAAMIDQLRNSDWVQQGRAFYDKNDAKCPFCQQMTKETLNTSFNDYFDKSFVADTTAIRSLETEYKSASDKIHDELEKLIQTGPKFLKTELLKMEKELLEASVKANLIKIAQKKSEPSRVVTLDPVSEHTKAIQGLIDAANKEADVHNEMVKNRATERNTLIGQVWRYLLDNEFSTLITEYDKEKTAIEKAIKGIQEGIAAKEAWLVIKRKELQELEKKTTSVQPTITDINKLLKTFGFQGFSLAIGSKPSTYKIVRADGSPAKDTLSEGERTFVTFLYFFHLLKGNQTASDVSVDRVVVFDDPVSSLDSDVLHIVSCLIKSLLTDVRDSKMKIKQVFIFTHNTYFHKEVSFFGNKELPKDVFTYWVIRKKDNQSTITKHEKNPVKTHYEMLWADVSKGVSSAHTIPNVLRRILETSTRLLGGMEVDEVHKFFEGDERAVCRALLSWANDGSHFAHDDLFVSDDLPAVDTYLKVFRTIFEKCGHINHFKMMMGEQADNGARGGS
jgi:wobble nucleotide-excising tRNase